MNESNAQNDPNDPNDPNENGPNDPNDPNDFLCRDDCLRGVRVLVAGAGLAGLTAAAELIEHGADALVIEARRRLGGRVWTLREGFADGQHAEAGADLIDESQTAIRGLAGELGLNLVRILPGGFSGKSRVTAEEGIDAWASLQNRLEPEVRAYRLADRRWDSAIAQALARESVSQWLDRIHASEALRSTALAMQGFFSADPGKLSLLALVDQFADDESPGDGPMFRVEGGNDAIASALGSRLKDRLRMGTTLLSLAQSLDGVEAAVVGEDGRVDRIRAAYVVCALPASTLRDVRIDPPLPEPQREAIEQLKYGPATRTLLQFDRAPWRRRGQPRAFGTDLPIGAVWDGNEEQAGPAGILTLLAGGAVSTATRELLEVRGVDGLVTHLDWLGIKEARLIAHQSFIWENDPWARGAYAYFDTSYDPKLRSWLARPCGHVLFAGEHTSIRWQGYMNGAVESGLRAAAEVVALHSGHLH